MQEMFSLQTPLRSYEERPPVTLDHAREVYDYFALPRNDSQLQRKLGNLAQSVSRPRITVTSEADHGLQAAAADGRTPLFIANHPSHADPIGWAALLYGPTMQQYGLQAPCMMAKSSLTAGVFGRVLEAAGCVPVFREKDMKYDTSPRQLHAASLRMIELVQTYLAAGQPVLIAPAGECEPDQYRTEKKSIRSGVVRIVKDSPSAPVFFVAQAYPWGDGNGVRWLPRFRPRLTLDGPMPAEPGASVGVIKENVHRGLQHAVNLNRRHGAH